MQFGQVAIGDIWLDPKSRDDIPAVLKGLQYLYTERRDELFGLWDSHIRPGTDRTVGRPGMDLWRILVLGVLKQGLGCDFDRLHDLANHHRTVLTVFLGREKIGLRGARGQLQYPTSDCYPLEFRKRFYFSGTRT